MNRKKMRKKKAAANKAAVFYFYNILWLVILPFGVFMNATPIS